MSEKQANFTLLNGHVNMTHSFYNPTSDAVWLAAFAPTSVKKVLDVGIGTGGVSLCLLTHNPNATIIGLDISQEMLDICQQNIKLNKFDNIKLLKQDILDWSTTERFDLIISNPPYFNGTPAKHNAHHNIDIKKWVKCCCARVAPNGWFCVITDTLCLDKIISVLENKHFGNIQIFPLFGAKNRAERVLVRAKQGTKTGCTLYQGAPMNNDAVLRDGLTIDTILSKLVTL